MQSIIQIKAEIKSAKMVLQASPDDEVALAKLEKSEKLLKAAQAEISANPTDSELSPIGEAESKAKAELKAKAEAESKAKAELKAKAVDKDKSERKEKALAELDKLKPGAASEKKT